MGALGVYMKPIYSIRATEQSIAEINRDIRAQMDLPLDTRNFMIIDALLDERERLEAELAKLEAIE
jgi:hypothetical protein